ncbi:HNH endonuclease [Mycobacterium marinum]|uniref:HNH endonuclease n=3 Tax=Mycobacterium marinum TaxID=1781 RepID=UPI001FCE31FA|nr:HNH endonuclease [Mycobacterium marinum]
MHAAQRIRSARLRIQRQQMRPDRHHPPLPRLRHTDLMPRAPRRCPGGNGTCTELIVNRRYCPEHTIAWSGERTASSRVTSQRYWKEHFKPAILERDGYQCQIRYEGICTGYATTVDKIVPAARRPDLACEPSNARAACDPCNEHKARTADRGLPEPPRMPI